MLLNKSGGLLAPKPKLGGSAGGGGSRCSGLGLLQGQCRGDWGGMVRSGAIWG